MTLLTRSVIVVGLMSVALVASVIDGLDNGWTTLGVVAVVCFAVTIVAQLDLLRRAKRHA